jgi:hypothetical protein
MRSTSPGIARQNHTCKSSAGDAIDRLIKIAFANMDDFARFHPDGSVEIFDYDKAHEVGAKVSVVTRKIGRGKNTKEVRITKITMPKNKFSALIRLGKLLGMFKPQGRRRERPDS